APAIEGAACGLAHQAFGIGDEVVNDQQDRTLIAEDAFLDAHVGVAFDQHRGDPGVWRKPLLRGSLFLRASYMPKRIRADPSLAQPMRAAIACLASTRAWGTAPCLASTRASMPSSRLEPGS